VTARRLVTAGVCAVLVPLMSALPPVLPESPAWLVIEAGATAPQTIATPDVPVRSTRIERRDASGSLSTAVSAIQRADSGPLWIAWSVPAVASREGHGNRWGDGEVGRCVLDDEGDIRNSHGINGGTRRLVILVRSQAQQITRVAFTDERCVVDAGSRPVYFLAGVAPDQSVALLAQLVREAAPGREGDRKDRPREQALPALALHGSPAADAALAEFVKPGQVRDVRRDAAFWLGAARGEAGAAVVERLARGDDDDDFREHLTFVLTLIGDRGIDPLITMAKRDSSAKVRGQALFWLGQKAGQRAVAALEGAIADDPDRDVRKKAVFALSQLPKDDGVPKLIAVARTHRDPEVRKQAMFWLGQSGDERAVQFFEQVLKN
jgi:HEAT repeat protein